MSKNNVKKVILQFELLTSYYSNLSCKMSYTPNLAMPTISSDLYIYARFLTHIRVGKWMTA